MISKSIMKKDHRDKTSGKARYIADYQQEGMLYGKVLRSEKAHAKILGVRLPILEEGYGYINGEDFERNALKIIGCEQPILAQELVRFIGEGILMYVGPDPDRLDQYVQDTEIRYEELEAVFCLEESSKACVSYAYEHGEVDAAFSSASEIYEETLSTGYQEQAYIEPQGMIASYHNGKFTVTGSMQCPYYVKEAVMYAMAASEQEVQVIQSTTGGAFGGKEDYPSLIACLVACASKKFGKPVQLIYPRREDMAVTTKRHPSRFHYRVALDADGTILGMKAEIRINGGAYEGLSSVVLQRAMITVLGVYKIPAIRVEGWVMETNTVPTGAFRGFGGPQSFFGIETLMSHLAKYLAQPSFVYKQRFVVKQGDPTATRGEFHDPVILPDLMKEVVELSQYRAKVEKYQAQRGRYRKGIGLTMFLHGCGFTGSAEQEFIRSVVQLVKDEDDALEILVSNTDMGQGVKTAFCKIVGEVLGVPAQSIQMVDPDTDRVPNSGPTVASRSVMIVGKLLERAALRMKASYISGKYQVIEEKYVHPKMIPWDLNTFTGDAYPTFSWGVNVIEVQVDMLTGCTDLLGVYGVYDVGIPIDDEIIRGQIEGGMLQGIGYASSEKMEIHDGRVRQSSFTDYMIPTAKDSVPILSKCISNPYEGGPFGAKGAGELTILGAAPAYVEAIEMAIGAVADSIPLTPEKILDLIGNNR